MTTVLIGNPGKLAIRSSMAAAYERLGAMALGSFQVIVNGLEYGKSSCNATLLACSFDAVVARIEAAGTHVAPFSSNSSSDIALAYVSALFGDENGESEVAEISREAFLDSMDAAHIVWAPDGDEAFDDGSVILQFDLKDNVRLVCFKRTDDGISQLTDITLSSVEFYGVLRDWRSAFFEEWRSTTKTVEQSH